MALLRKLPQRLLRACARYWNNKEAQFRLVDEHFKALPSPIQGVQWDKEADLRHIEEVARKTPKLYWEACVGTFWFRRGRVCIRVSEVDRAGVRTLNKLP